MYNLENCKEKAKQAQQSAHARAKGHSVSQLLSRAHIWTDNNNDSNYRYWSFLYVSRFTPASAASFLNKLLVSVTQILIPRTRSQQ